MIKFHSDIVQGTQQWHEARRGLLTASEMGRIVTPKLKVADNEKTRAHVYEIAAQRISGVVEVGFLGDEMLRGHEDEIDARDLYREKYGEVDDVGFITNDKWGFTIGYSPDGLVGDDGLIEIKSRRQRFQVETIANHEVPQEHVIQVQTALLVSEREWIDFISFSAGLPMAVITVAPDPTIHEAIIAAATAFEAKVAEVVEAYSANVKKHGFHPTERRLERDMGAIAI